MFYNYVSESNRWLHINVLDTCCNKYVLSFSYSQPFTTNKMKSLVFISATNGITADERRYIRIQRRTNRPVASAYVVFGRE